MSTTISRYSFLDDTGDGESGDVINAALIGAAIYDKIDALIAANISFGGTVSAVGVGTHDFSGAGTGGNPVKVRNSTAGTGNFAALRLGNDGSTVGQIALRSSTYTTVGGLRADAVDLYSDGSG